MENILELENVTMQFGGVVAVNNLSLKVGKDEIVALIGPNGVGKTTAFNCRGVRTDKRSNQLQRQEDNCEHPSGKDEETICR